MKRFTFQFRHLFLLALFQLVAGPLVLLQVSVFCSLTVREAPRQGLAVAAVKAWHHPTFQSLLAASNTSGLELDKRLPAGNDGNTAPAKVKLHFLAWLPLPALCQSPVKLTDWTDPASHWTPAWPQAPPGPPPRSC